MAGVVRKLISSGPCVGAYSPGVLVDHTLYISGQIGLDASSNCLVAGGIENEAKKALENMGDILKAAGCSYNNVVKTTVLLTDLNNTPVINKLYEHYFQGCFPARACYQVSALPKGAAVEIEAIAVVANIVDS